MADVVKDTDLGFNEILRQTEKFAQTSILIGFQEGSTTKTAVKGHREKEGGKSMPEIAFENEFGTKKIPQRSFMRTSFDENIVKIEKFIINQYKKVQDGKIDSDQASGLIGVFMVNSIKRKIRAIKTPPNSPTTIKLKGSSKPLIDFGQMIQSVTYKVE